MSHQTEVVASIRDDHDIGGDLRTLSVYNCVVGAVLASYLLVGGDEDAQVQGIPSRFVAGKLKKLDEGSYGT